MCHVGRRRRVVRDTAELSLSSGSRRAMWGEFTPRSTLQHEAGRAQQTASCPGIPGQSNRRPVTAGHRGRIFEKRLGRPRCCGPLVCGCTTRRLDAVRWAVWVGPFAVLGSTADRELDAELPPAGAFAPAPTRAAAPRGGGADSGLGKASAGGVRCTRQRVWWAGPRGLREKICGCVMGAYREPHLFLQPDAAVPTAFIEQVPWEHPTGDI